MSDHTLTVPYTIQSISEGLSRALFTIPSHQADFLISSPVTCRGGSFDLHIMDNSETTDTNGGESVITKSIYTDFYSPDPSQTADAIAIRLKARLQDPNLPSASDACIIT